MSNTDLIIEKLKNKASLKQKVSRVTEESFNELKKVAKKMALELNEKMPKDIDENVKIEFFDINQFEFRLKFSGDTLAFIRHSNVVKLHPENPIVQNKYMEEDKQRTYFGSIRVYDFLSDSFRYNRYQDAGILMARLLVNLENHYHIDSGIHFKALKQSVEKNVLDEKTMRFFIENAMITAIDIDLIAPQYKDIFTVSLKEHFENNQGDAGTKLGFQMRYEGGDY